MKEQKSRDYHRFVSVVETGVVVALTRLNDKNSLSRYKTRANEYWPISWWDVASVVDPDV